MRQENAALDLLKQFTLIHENIASILINKMISLSDDIMNDIFNIAICLCCNCTLNK